jgi:hypothetical protein
MPQQGMIYRALVASPSDCVHERKVVPETIHYWNSINSLPLTAIIEPVLWETHANPAFGNRPQAIINRQLVDVCDILIGTFWTRLGSPTGQAPSGTVEEIEKFLADGKPVLLYFSVVPVAPGSYNESQFKALIEYREQLRARGLLFEYDTLAGLREQLLRHLSRTMTQQHGNPFTPPPSTENNDAAIRQLKGEFAAFLRRLEAEWSSERDSGPYSIDEGKLIMHEALSEVLTSRARIVQDSSGALSKLLDEVARQLRELQRHELVMDGGVSFRGFWEKGNTIIQLLKRANEALQSEGEAAGRDLLPPPQMEIVSPGSYFGRLNSQDGQFAVLLKVRFRNESEQPVLIQELRIQYAGHWQTPTVHTGLLGLHISSGTLAAILRLDDNITKSPHIPAMDVIERSAYFLLPNPPVPFPGPEELQLTAEATFANRSPRQIAFTLTEQGKIKG